MFILAAFTTVAFANQADGIASFNEAARARNVSAFVSALAPNQKLAEAHLNVLKTNGVYGVGSLGWKAEGDSDHLVVTTSLTSEDVGDLVFRRVNGKLVYVPETETLGVAVRNHDIKASFDIPSKTAKLVNRVTFRSAGSGDWLFRMSPCYRVSRIVGEDGTAVSYKQLGGVVFLKSQPAKEFTYTITYGGKVDLPQYAGSISESEISLTNDYWYPMIARQPSPYSITATVPTGWTVVGQGKRQSVNGNTTTYRMDLPVVYYSFAAGPYKLVETQIKGKTYRAWSPRLSERELKTSAELYAPIVEYFESVFGPFPFPGYGALDSPAYGGGALEAYSHATWGGGLPMEDSHETAHTYWGGLVNNSYLDDLWNESFAVFSEGLYARNVKIGDASSRKFAFVSECDPSPAYAQVPVTKGSPFVGGVAVALGYGKGAKVLQMLESMVGTQSVIRSMKAWKDGQDPYRSSDWAGFRKVASREIKDQDLAQFFADWLDAPGWVKFRLRGASFAAGKVNLDIEFSSTPKLVPAEVMLEYPDGNRVFKNIRFRQSGTVSLDSARKPSRVVLDPWNRVLRERQPGDIPDSIGSSRGRKRITDEKQSWFEEGWSRSNDHQIPTDPAGSFIVGHPDTLPGFRALCEKVGFKVTGNMLTFGQQRVNLAEGGAMALVPLANGKSCVIGLGKLRSRPETGRARIALLDHYGRLTYGVTDPMRSGPLAAKL